MSSTTKLCLSPKCDQPVTTAAHGFCAEHSAQRIARIREVAEQLLADPASADGSASERHYRMFPMALGDIMILVDRIAELQTLVHDLAEHIEMYMNRDCKTEATYALLEQSKTMTK